MKDLVGQRDGHSRLLPARQSIGIAMTASIYFRFSSYSIENVILNGVKDLVILRRVATRCKLAADKGINSMLIDLVVSFLLNAE